MIRAMKGYLKGPEKYKTQLIFNNTDVCWNNIVMLTTVINLIKRLQKLSNTTISQMRSSDFPMLLKIEVILTEKP